MSLDPTTAYVSWYRVGGILPAMSEARAFGADDLSRWMLWPAVAGAVSLGYVVVHDPRIAVIVFVGAGVGWLAIQRNLGILVPLTTVALVLGSSTLPGGSLWFFAKFAMIGAVAATIPAIATPREHLPVPVGFAVGYGALVGLMLASTAWSVAPTVTRDRAISMLLLWLAVAIAIPLGLRDHEDLWRLMHRVGVVAAGAVVAGLILGAVGLTQWFDSGRFQGILVNPNTLGYFVAPILPALVILAARSGRNRSRTSLIVVIAVLTIGLALTGSRAGAIASVAGIVAALFASRVAGESRTARRMLVGATIGVGAMIVAFSSLHVPLRNEGTAREGFFELGTGSLRTVAWADALQLIAERPLLGHGFATTPVLFPAVQSRTQGKILGDIHNSFLEAGVDLGLLGSLWLSALAISGLLGAWRVSRSRGRYRWIGAVLLAGIVGGMVNGIFETGLLAAGGLISFHFWMMVVMAHSIRLQRWEGARRDKETIGAALGRV